MIRAAAIIFFGVAAGCGEARDRGAWAGKGMVCTQLFFGMSSREGPVTEAGFERFLDEVVTPAFPEGYTVEAARGRWKGAAEDSRVVVIVHGRDAATAGSIWRIREAYKLRFHQQSVLEVDTDAVVRF